MKIADISVDYIGHYGTDHTVANAARVSFHKDADNYSDEQNDKLIKYLAKNKHFSPFNHTFISLRIKAPIFVARQMVKHKFLPWNEVSRRYVDEEPEFFFPDYWRAKSNNVKQGSSEDKVPNDVGVDLGAKILCEDHILFQYQWMLDQGVAPEQARMILPQNMMTEWIWSGTLGAYCDMLRLRLDPHTQYESRIVANKVKEIIEPLFPVSVKALLETE